jgi:hypothetical protein
LRSLKNVFQSNIEAGAVVNAGTCDSEEAAEELYLERDDLGANGFEALRRGDCRRGVSKGLFGAEAFVWYEQGVEIGA